MKNDLVRDLMVRSIGMTFDDERDNPELKKELKKMYIPNVFSENFAKMIVSECISVCGEEHSDTLKKHFGIENV